MDQTSPYEVGNQLRIERDIAVDKLRRAKAEVTELRGVLKKSCNDHIALAGLYEAGGNTRGAMQLRAVGNLLGVILQGGIPTTVCPPADTIVQVTDDDGEAD